MTTEIRKPLPSRQDLDNGEFWNGTDRGELRVKRCGDCSRYHWPPRLGCPYCGSGKLAWVAVGPRGEVFSWTVVHRSQTPGFETETPYAVVLVELEDGGRMIANVIDCPLERLRIGMPVEAAFEKRSDEVTLPQFRPRG